MKVKDLRELLEKLDQEAEVIVSSSNFEQNNAKISVSYVHQYNEGQKKTESFRDAFDGETYSKDTYSIIGGNTPVVMIS